MPQGETRKATKAHDEKRSKKPSAAWEPSLAAPRVTNPLGKRTERSCGLCSVVILVDPGPLSRVTFLGANLSDFMTQLGMTPTGGRTGTITRLRRQINRLFDAAISVQYHGREQSTPV